MVFFRKKTLSILFLLLVLLPAGCSRSVSINQAFPQSGAVTGWQATSEAVTYNKDTIFQLMDGQAEYFFRYGFELVAVRSYQNSQGNNLETEVWQLATTADAYGLFSANDLGAPAKVGQAVDANIQDGTKLVFWQDRYFVLVRPAAPIENAELTAFGEAISKALPAGGDPPGIVQRLPLEGKIERSEIFFHEEITVQNEIWLGGENILGLSPQTNAILARYDLSGAVEQLLLVEYPDAASASTALAVLNAGNVEEFQAAKVEGNTLAAAFGTGVRSAVLQLLDQALAR